MTTTDCATDIAMSASQSEDPQNETPLRESGGASKSLKGLLFGFAATVTIGLLLASWYVGVRIVAADGGAPASTALTQPTAQPVTQLSAPQATATQSPDAKDSIAESFWYTVPPADLYLQAGGMAPSKTRTL